MISLRRRSNRAFLVSVKLILMSYKNAVASDKLHAELVEIRALIREMNGRLRSK